MRKIKLKQTDLHKSLPNLANIDSMVDRKPTSATFNQWSNDAGRVYHAGSASSLNENGSLLEGRIQLQILLPNGTPIRMNVEAKTPMMDLLVQVTTTNGINPGGMYLKVPTDRPPGYLHYKPNTPIGTLNCNTLEIVPKFEVCERPRKQMPKKANLPFEPTTRIQVDLPKNQKSVFRLSPQLSLYDIHRRICQETKYDVDSYELRTSKCPGLPLDLNVKLCDSGTVNFVLVSSRESLSKSTGDLFGLYAKMPIEEKEKHKSRGFFWFLRRKQKRKASLEGAGKGSDPNLSSNRNVDSLLRDKRLLTTDYRPLSLQFEKDGLIKEAPVDANDVENAVWHHRHGKKRPAPKPPVETVQTKVIHSPLSSYDVNNATSESEFIDDVGDTSKKTQHQRINERRHSDSTSSGYHDYEDSSVAQSPSPELVLINDKHQTSATDSSYVERSVSEKSGSSGASSSAENRPPVLIETTALRDNLDKRNSTPELAIAESDTKRKSRAPPPPEDQSEESYSLAVGILEKFHDGLELESMTEDKIYTSNFTSRSSSPATAEEVDQNFQEVIQQVEAELSADSMKEFRQHFVHSLYHNKIDNDTYDMPIEPNDKVDKILNSPDRLSSKIGPSRIFVESNEVDSVNRRVGEPTIHYQKQADDVDSRMDKLISGRDFKSNQTTTDSLISSTDLGLNNDWIPEGGPNEGRQRIQIEPDVEIVRENLQMKRDALNPISTNLTDDWEPASSLAGYGNKSETKMENLNYVTKPSNETGYTAVVKPVDTNFEDSQSDGEELELTYRPPVTARTSKTKSIEQSLEDSTRREFLDEKSDVVPSTPLKTGLDDDWEPLVHKPPEYYLSSRIDQETFSTPPVEEKLETRNEHPLDSGLDEDWIPDAKPPVPSVPPPTEETVTPSPVHQRNSVGVDNPLPYKRRIIVAQSPKSTISSVDSPLKLNIVDASDNWSSVSSPKYRYDYSNSPRTNSTVISPRSYQPISPQSKITVKDSKRANYPTMTVKNFEDEYYAKEMKDEYMRQMKYGIIESEKRNDDEEKRGHRYRSLPPTVTMNTLPRIAERRKSEISDDVKSNQTDKSPPEKMQKPQKVYAATPVVAVSGDEKEDMLYREYDKLQAMFALWQERLKQNEAIVRRGEKLSATNILEFQRLQSAMMEQHKFVQKLCPEDQQKTLEKMMNEEQEVSSKNSTTNGETSYQKEVSYVNGRLSGSEEDKNGSFSSVQNGVQKTSTPVKEDKFRQQTVNVIRSSRNPDGATDYHELSPSDNLLNNNDDVKYSSVDTSSNLKPTQMVAAKKYFETTTEVKPIVNDFVTKVNEERQIDNVVEAVGERRENGEEEYGGYGFGNLVSKTIYISNPTATSRRSEIPPGLYVSRVNFSPTRQNIENVESHSSAVYYDVQIRESRVVPPTQSVKRDVRTTTYFIPPPPVPTTVSVADQKNGEMQATTITHDQNFNSVDGIESRDDLFRSFGGTSYLNHA